MSDQTIFGNTEQPQATPEQTNPLDALTTKLAEIKDEQGTQKYDSLEKAVDALKHSQEYIPTLKGELSEKDRRIAELEAKLNASSSVQEQLEQLAQQQNSTSEDTTQREGLDEQAVLGLVKNFLDQQSVETTKKSNFNQVNSFLTDKFGDKANEVAAAKAGELGVSLEQFKKLSEESPKVVLELFGAASAQSTGATTSSIHLPTNMNSGPTLAPPEKSILRGASSKDQVDFMRKVKAYVYEKYNVEQ